MCTNQRGFSILNFTLGISNVEVRVFTYLSFGIGCDAFLILCFGIRLKIYIVFKLIRFLQVLGKYV